jgi:hypothetical protein
MLEGQDVGLCRVKNKKEEEAAHRERESRLTMSFPLSLALSTVPTPPKSLAVVLFE